MPEIIWKYYAGRGPEAEDVIARAKKAWNDVLAARQSLMEEYGANGILPGDKKRYTVAGLLFYEKPEFNFMTYAEATQKTADGKSFFVATPNLKNLDGRALAQKLAAPEVTFDRKNELINLLDLSCMADFTASANQTSSSVVWSSAKAAGNTVLVAMPADASKQHILGKAPKMPKWMKLVKKAEYDFMLEHEGAMPETEQKAE